MIPHQCQSFVIFTASLALLFTVSTTNGHPYPRHFKNTISGCEQLGTALSNVYHQVMLPVYDQDQVLAEVKMVAGINPEDEAQVKKFACSLEGSRSVKDLARHFRLPFALSRQMYGELMEELSRCGGVQGCKVYMQMMNALAAWVHDVNYSTWPLHTTYAQTSKFLRKMAAEYGPDFLSGQGLTDGSQDTAILVTEDTVDALTQSLVEARSLEDLARLTGFPLEAIYRLDNGLQVLARAGPYVASSNAALEQLMVTADHMGLLYLPEQ